MEIQELKVLVLFNNVSNIFNFIIMGSVVIIARAHIRGGYGEFIIFLTMSLILIKARAFVKVFDGILC